MPAVSLFQSRFSHQLELELEDDAVVVTDRAMTRSRKYRVPLEHLALTAEEVTVWSQRRLALTCLCLGLLVLVAIIRIDGGDVGADAELFYAVLAALGLGAFIGSRQTYLITQGHPPLVVMKNKPSPLAVTAFLEQVQSHRRQHVASRFLLGTPEAALVDELHKLALLQQSNAISEAEFLALKADIMRRASPYTPPPPSPN
jgi:hypothetical protein